MPQIAIPVRYDAVVRLEGHRSPFLCNVFETPMYEVRELTGEEALVVLRYRNTDPNQTSRKREIRKSEGNFYSKIFDHNPKQQNDSTEWTFGRYLQTPNLFIGHFDTLAISESSALRTASVGGRPFPLPNADAADVVEWHDAPGRDIALAKAAIVADGVVSIDGERWYGCREPVLSFRYEHWNLKTKAGAEAFLSSRPGIDIDFSRAGTSSALTDYTSSVRLALTDSDLLDHHGFELPRKDFDVVDPAAFSFDSQLEAVVKFARAVHRANGWELKKAPDDVKAAWAELDVAIGSALRAGEGAADALYDAAMQAKELFPSTAGDRTENWDVARGMEFVRETVYAVRGRPKQPEHIGYGLPL